MDKNIPLPSSRSEQVVALLRSEAASIARNAESLALRIAAERYSFESEFSFSYSHSNRESPLVPEGEHSGGMPPYPIDHLQRLLSERADPPCVIPAVPVSKTKRPLWTVAIPACNPDPENFSLLIMAVTKALSKTASWEIVIVDRSSEKTDWESMLAIFSKHPIQIFRYESGPMAALNECLRRSKGQYVHLLRQEDFIYDQFYSELGGALKSHPEVELASCFHAFQDYLRRPRFVLPTSEASGCYSNLQFAHSWAYRLDMSALVVRRSQYERLGGFCEDLGLWAEWEMRARLLASSPLCFLKDILVLIRVQSESWRQRERQAAPGVDACERALSLAAKCFPEPASKIFADNSSFLFARAFTLFGSCLLGANRMREGMAHLSAAMQLSRHPGFSETASRISFFLLKSQTEAMLVYPDSLEPEGPANGDAKVLSGDYFPQDEIQELEDVVAAYRASPADKAAVGQVRALRDGLCSYLLDSEKTELEKLFSGNFAKMFSLLRESGFVSDGEESREHQLEKRANDLIAASSEDLRGLLAMMLLCPAHWANLPVELAGKPEWFSGFYLDYLMTSPEGFVYRGEAEMYMDHLSTVLAAVERAVASVPVPPAVAQAAFHFALRLNLIPAYFAQRDMKALMRARARVLAFLLEQKGYKLNAAFPPRPFQRKKIRAGFLSAHLGPQTETYTSAASFYLDREKFDVHLFVLASNPSAIEDHCRSVSDSFTVLPAELGARVEALRGADLDVLVIGTNMTAVTNDMTLLAMHRLAPIQIASSSSPMTPGLPHLDGYLSGIIHGYDAYTGQFNERLLLFDGAISCLEYSVDRPKEARSFSRNEFGIPDGVPLFVSGANFFKILPELQSTWAEILKQVPGSYLLLHPFNPNWTNRYPVARFRRDIFRAFEQAGVEPTRIKISEEKLPSRADVRQMMALGDVYLDSYPFSGSVSLVDPLEAGVPAVAWRAGSVRGLMAASMLSDLDLRELVAESEEEFIAAAVRLATEPLERERISKKIRSAMAAVPRFYDVKKYGCEVSRVLEELVLAERKVEEAPDAKVILRRAEEALAAGRFGETEDLCRQLLERAPENAAGWALLGELARRSGDLNYAAELMDQAVALEPKKAKYWSTLGEIRLDQKDLDAALAAFLHVVDLRPNAPNAWLSLAIVHDERKEADKAEHAYNQAIRFSKERVETAQIRVNFAGFLREQNRIKEGIKQLRRAGSEVHEELETMLLLGSFLREGGELAEAISTFSRAAKKHPNIGRCWMEWGKALFLLDKNEEALEKMRKAVTCQPNDPEVLFNLGYALQRNLQRTEALQVYFDAERAGCDTGDLHTNIGVLLKDQEQYMEAAQRFHKSCERNPESHAAMNNLGAVCINLGLTTEAIDCFQHALRLNPTMTAPHNNLGHMLKISGKAAEGLDYYLKGLNLAPGNKEMMHNYLLCTLYQTNLTPQAVFEEHRKFGALLAADIKTLPGRRILDGHPQGRIRIGYVSPDFCVHPVAFFAGSLFDGRDRERFEIYAYSDVRKEDAVTERFRSMADVWRNVSEMQNQEVAELIRKDEIDILVDLCGHTAHNRLEVMAAKPAPIIVSYLGYPATTGVPGVEFRITDATVDPLGKTDALHTEKLVRLDRCAWCFDAPVSSPPVGPLPAEKNRFITFGCFNNLAKLNAPLYDLWVEILRQVPDSRLFLKAKTLIDPGICQEVRDYFTARGIPLDRLRVSGFEVNFQNHFDRYNEVDIALDSYPYHGTTTTCEALWMGVPVITLAGEAHMSRVGVSLLRAVGHPELVAASDEEYVRLAVELARDPARLSSLRAVLRGQMMASPILDHPGFIRAIENAFNSLLAHEQRA